MSGVRLNYDLSGLKGISDKLRRAGAQSPKILKRAVNHTGAKATVAMRKALVPQTGLKRRTLDKAVKGAPSGSGYVIRSQGGDVRLKYFGARETSKGVSAAPWNSRRVYGGTFIRSGWWPNRRGVIANGQVLRRSGASKFPVKVVRSGLFIPQEMVIGQSEAAFYRTLDTDLAPRIAHELGRVLG